MRAGFSSLIGVAAIAACNFGNDPFSDVVGTTGDGGDDAPADDAMDDGDGDGADDGMATGGGASSGGSEGPAPGTEDGPAESSGDGPIVECPQLPTRFIVLGDSIFACFGVGGKGSEDCSARQTAEYITENITPVTYENLAVNGAQTDDVADSQLGTIEIGPGHALVMIFIGGNDLAQYIFSSDEQAVDAWNNTTGPLVAEKWEQIFTFLEDPANFPDGVTLLINTQYNPFDDCTAPPYETVTATKIELLHQHNEALIERARAHDYAYIVDQFTPYLGHGHHVDVAQCPHYNPDYEGWMFDLIHPNPTGHADLAAQIRAVVDDLYGSCG